MAGMMAEPTMVDRVLEVLQARFPKEFEIAVLSVQHAMAQEEIETLKEAATTGNQQELTLE